MRARWMTRSLVTAGLLAACLASPAQAQSGAAQRAALKIFQDYVSDGRIDPCRHTSQELQLAHDNIPPDIEQYAADYPAAIAAALEARARGDCAAGKPAAAVAAPPVTTPAPTADPTPIPTTIPTKTVVPDPPAPVTAAAPAGTAAPRAQADVALERVAVARPANEAPAPLLLLAVLTAALACVAALLVTMKRLGIGEEHFAGAAHAWREARWRSAGTWDDFRDWLRIGR